MAVEVYTPTQGEPQAKTGVSINVNNLRRHDMRYCCSTMTEHIQPVHASNLKNVKSAGTQKESSDIHDDCGSLSGLESRENTIRNAVKKWFGPLETLDPKARAGERERHETILHTLFRLHRLSCNLVPEQERIPVSEQDVFSTIIVLNRIAITVRCPSTTIIAYCEARAVREKNPRANQLDPLQLRHLLSFHQDIPHEELNALDIQTLRNACEKNDKKSIQVWFETIAKRKSALPNGAPQFLRQLLIDLWDAGYRDYLETFATELAVLDSAMFEAMGWENTRLFLAVFKRIHGASCRSASAFLGEGEIHADIEMYKRVGDTDQIIHFRALATTFDPKAQRRLELMILSASKERGSRISIARPTPLEQKKAVPYVTSADIPAIFSRKNLHVAG